MQTEFDEIHAAWESFEDEVRQQNPTAYVELEGALDVVKQAVVTRRLVGASLASPPRWSKRR
jgi:hypothetical protein